MPTLRIRMRALRKSPRAHLRQQLEPELELLTTRRLFRKLRLES